MTVSSLSRMANAGDVDFKLDAQAKICAQLKAKQAGDFTLKVNGCITISINQPPQEPQYCMFAEGPIYRLWNGRDYLEIQSGEEGFDLYYRGASTGFCVANPNLYCQHRKFMGSNAIDGKKPLVLRIYFNGQAVGHYEDRSGNPSPRYNQILEKAAFVCGGQQPALIPMGPMTH